MKKSILISVVVAIVFTVSLIVGIVCYNYGLARGVDKELGQTLLTPENGQAYEIILAAKILGKNKSGYYEIAWDDLTFPIKDGTIIGKQIVYRDGEAFEVK